MRKLLFIVLASALISQLFAADSGQIPNTNLLRMTATRPNTDEKTHHAGSLFFTVSNWGFFGSQRGSDDPNYCYIDDEGICGQTGVCRPSAEYPGCSGIEYLFQGALWIGGVIAGDTLVSVGEDGWETGVHELFPGYGANDTIQLRSILSNLPIDSNAVSEEDYVCNLSDTVMNSTVVDPTHRALGIGIHQESYAWSYDYAKNFVFIDYTFYNLRTDERTIEDVFIGIYIDADCGHVQTDDYAQDDITGFIRNYIDETGVEPVTIPVMLAWIADNDGDPEEGVYTEKSPTGAMACRVLRGPWGTTIDTTDTSTQFAFNWWISNINETYDWGPCQQDLGFDGTPTGDLNKYKVMSNGEFDFDQTAVMDSSSPGCAMPSDEEWKKNIANGYDTRFLLSFGPITIEPQDCTHVTIAFLVGEDFHNNPSNVCEGSGSAWSPEFNFDELGYSAYWVSIIFDNPGVDTDPTDTIPPPPEDMGDGVPDYKGPAPPPSPPDVHIVTGANKITIYWRGDSVENVLDDITKVRDFEGYRIYIAEANLDNYFVPLVQFDRVDYLHYSKMVDILDSMSADSVDSFFHCRGIYLDTAFLTTESYTCTIYNQGGDTLRDTVLAPEKISYNLGMPPTKMMRFEGDAAQDTYYYYTIDNLLPGDDKYVVITSFDFGQPSKGLGSLETSKTKYSKWVVPPGASAGTKTVRVVPNPYRVDHDYSEFWEKSFTGSWTEYSRKLRFFNIPERCKIRIFTLDGDLVKELEHDETTGDAEMVGAEDWNLVSRNDQAIVSGIYIFSVEDLSNGETQTGKFVVIK